MAVDYTKMIPMGSTNGSPESNPDKRWWALDKEEIPATITGIIGFLQSHQGARMTQQLISARLYGNLSIMGLNGLTYSKIASVQNSLRDRISYNLVQSAIDTLVSKITKSRPKPMFLTSGGDYKLQRRAKKLEKFVEGVFYENNAYDEGTHVFRDGAVFGDGFTHVFDHYGRVKHERVLAAELYVDEVEGFYGYPRQLHRVKNIDRFVMCDVFPDKKKQILAAHRATPDSLGGYQNISDVITVRESWHLPSGPEASDGIRVITLENGTLETEEWNKDWFPFARYSWNRRLYGYWGQGAAEQIQNIQLEVNKLLWVIQRSMHLAGSFKILLENGSKIVKEHLNNDIGAIVTYTGQQPTYVSPPIVQPEVYAHLQTLKQAAFEQLGVSQLSAQSKKPEGLDSGKALREFNDIESDRFNSTSHDYEKYYMDLAKLDVAIAKDIYERTGEMSVKVPNKKFIETIDWKDVDLEEDEYYMKIYPVSSLPSDPAGRLQTIQEYVQAGFMDPRTARKILDFPDLEQVEDLANAEDDYLNEVLEKIIEDGEYTPPEPFDDMELARRLALQYYAQGKSNGLEEEKLNLLRQFMAQLDMLRTQALQQVAPPNGAPQALPQAPPQSDLIPNLPQGAAA